MNFAKFLRIYLLPPEHGGWFLLLGPFFFGALAAAQPNGDLIVLLVLSLAILVTRQPLTLLIKAMSGRRARSDLSPALSAFGMMSLIDLVLLAVLLWRGHSYLLWLGIPAVIVLAWQMFLVSRREERQIGIELVGAGTLALAAPAAYWVSLGAMVVEGWVLWGLAWLYAASSILYVYLRLKQRRWTQKPSRNRLMQEGRRTLLYASFNLALTLFLAIAALVPQLTPVPYTLALAHYLFGIFRPAVGTRPARIGIEQSAATLVFYTILGLVFLTAQ